LQIYYISQTLGFLIWGALQKVMMYQMESNFVQEQPAYEETIREHTAVDWPFLITSYTIFGSIFAYIIGKIVWTRILKKKSNQQLQEVTFYKMFIDNKSIYYREDYEKYKILRKTIIEKHCLLFWETFLGSYYEMLKSSNREVINIDKFVETFETIQYLE